MKKFKKLVTMISICAFALGMAGLSACAPEKDPDPTPPEPTPEIVVTLDKETGSITEGETLVLTATVQNSSEAPAFKTSNASVATVSVSGKTATVTGVAAGSATITASVGDKSAICAVTVTAKPVAEELSLDKEYIVMEDGGDAFNTATLTAEYSTAAETLEFASSDDEIVTVTSDGSAATLTANKIGVALITATLGEKTASCKVEVASYGLDYQLMELEIDEETTITALRVLDGEKNLTGDIRIPARYWSEEEEDFFPVVETAKDGFKESNGITSVYLGDELITVGIDSFRSCEGLVSVTTGDKLATIGAGAFYSCANLSTLNWAENCITSNMGANSFSFSGLTEIVIPATVTSFNYGMFQCAEKLERIKIYAPIVQIYDNTFLKSDSLAEIWLPATLTKISASAFGGYAGFPTDGPGSKGSFTVHFAGTQEQWNAVDISSSNNGAILKSSNSNLVVNFEVEY